MSVERLKIAVCLDDGYQPSAGGGFSYYDALVDAIDAYDFSEQLDICFVIRQRGAPVKLSLNKSVYSVVYPSSVFYYSLRLLRKIFQWNAVGRYISRPLGSKISSLEQQFFTKQLIEAGIHLIYYPKIDQTFRQYPFIMTNWDVGHRTLPPFPEVAMNGIYESRESYFRNVLNKAFMILVESELGKQELIRYYQFNEDKIKVFPMFPGKVVDLKVPPEEAEQYLVNWGLLGKKFFFYPAQFWSHKNHYNLLLAFAELLKYYPEVKLVFTGSDKGNESYIRAVCGKLGLQNSVLFLGFVSIEELYTLYTHAVALIMPTFLGPTNMPLLEADALGTTVLCSDLPGHQAQMGGRAKYFDPNDIQGICKLMSSTLRDKKDELPSIGYEVRCDLLENYFRSISSTRLAFGFNYYQK